MNGTTFAPRLIEMGFALGERQMPKIEAVPMQEVESNQHQVLRSASGTACQRAA